MSLNNGVIPSSLNMKKTIKHHLLTTSLISILSTMPSTSFSDENRHKTSEIEGMIQHYAIEANGIENKISRITDTSNHHYLVIFTVEYSCENKNMDTLSCSNAYSQHLTGFIQNYKIEPITIGGKWLFEAINISFDNGRVQIDGFKYRENDPACCPSIPYTIDGYVTGEKLSLSEMP
ncbi:hypothetical protein [Marinobacterium sp. xm-d-530]|uniref:hypothetical protein n=1 Tax=Marinobacterium sp. xm-d-530 TaxID=2497747 RepID=UPI0015682050|nr:hypothetical protein [Marinobacterium sp. xm-d-530]NRQ00828.1 hypothetical protein [Marinobacterium sp. xm-d-530]